MNDAQHAALLRGLKLQTALVKLSKDEPENLAESLGQTCWVAAQTLEVARVSIWLFNDDHSELQCVHLFDQSRNVTESGEKLYVNRYPIYFEALEKIRTIAAMDARRDSTTLGFSEDYLELHGIVEPSTPPSSVMGAPSAWYVMSTWESCELGNWMSRVSPRRLRTWLLYRWKQTTDDGRDSASKSCGKQTATSITQARRKELRKRRWQE